MDTLTPDDIEFLRSLANELKTQNTCGTAKPIFIQILEVERVVGFDPDYSDGTVLLMGDDYTEIKTIEDAKEFLGEYSWIDPDDLAGLRDLEDVREFCGHQDRIPCTLTGYKDTDRYHGCFLTRSGYDEHMRMNRHNYRHFHEPAKPYAQYMFRNPQLERLLTIVEKFAEEESQ